MLVIQPIGSPDDWLGLFHEAGHTEHFGAHTARALGGGSAALRQSTPRTPRGVGNALRAPRRRPRGSRQLDVGRLEFAAEGAANLLYYVAATRETPLRLEFHAFGNVTAIQPRCMEILGDALKIKPEPTDYLNDIDASFYVSRTSARGRSRRSCATTSEEHSGRRGSRIAGGIVAEMWGEG